MNKSKCIGCEQDFYNGKNPLGVKVCWHLEKAKIVWKKKVGLWQEPPWKQKRIRVPDCYQEKGYVFVDSKKER